MKTTTLSALLTLTLGTSLMAFNFSELFDMAQPVHKIVKDLNSNEQKASQEYLKRVNLQTVMPKKMEEEGVFVINTFIQILQNNNFEDSAHKVVPLMHKTLLTQDGRKMDEDTLRFSFKKAYTNAKNYSYPIRITRIDKLKTTEIGHGNTYEAGVEYKMWIAKKNSNGYAAPLVLFFKHGSSEPKLSYVGSI